MSHPELCPSIRRSLLLLEPFRLRHAAREACAQQMAVSDWHARKHLAVVELPLDQKRLDAVLCQRVSGAGTAGATADDGDAKGAIQSSSIADGLHLS